MRRIGMSSDDLAGLMHIVSNNSLAAAAAVTTAAAVGASTYYWATSKGRGGQPLPIDLDNQSVLIDEKEGIRTSVYGKDGKLMEYMFEDARTLYEGFQRGMRVSNNGPCLGIRADGESPFEWVTYLDVYNQAHAFGSSLQNELGLQPGTETLVGIFAANSIAWVVAEQACNMFSMVTVPLYATLGSEACCQIIEQCCMQALVVDTEEKIVDLLTQVAKMPTLRHLIVVSTISRDTEQRIKQAGLELFRYADMLEQGYKKLIPQKPPKPDDVATICYTSGTTGKPKGAILSHKAILSMLGAVFCTIQGPKYENLPLGPGDRYLSYLPLAHMFERSAHAFVFMNGMQLGFFRGDVRQLMDDLKELKPSIFCTVPRLLNRLYDKVYAGVANSRVKRQLLEWGLAKKADELQRGIIRNDGLWDRLVFHKIHEATGGRIRIVITGSAPLSEKVLAFVRASFGCHVFEAYGQTECTAGMTCTVPGESLGGLVGPPAPCNLVKLIDVPEMNYWTKDGKGEVCCKGNNLFSGYYKDPEMTAEALDRDGWLHSGDIGMWLDNGALKIIDRKKHIFKLAQGEYIAPEKLEQVYVQSNFVAQIFVDGDSFRSCAVAIVVPDEDYVMPWAERLGISGSFHELCAPGSALTHAILQDLKVNGKASGLKGFEMLGGIHLHSTLFSVENGFLTPTFKARRPELRRFFFTTINKIYEDQTLVQ